MTTCDTLEHCIPSASLLGYQSHNMTYCTYTLSYGDGGKLNVMNVFAFDNTDGGAVKGWKKHN